MSSWVWTFERSYFLLSSSHFGLLVFLNLLTLPSFKSSLPLKRNRYIPRNSTALIDSVTLFQHSSESQDDTL